MPAPVPHDAVVPSALLKNLHWDDEYEFWYVQVSAEVHYDVAVDELRKMLSSTDVDKDDILPEHFLDYSRKDWQQFIKDRWIIKNDRCNMTIMADCFLKTASAVRERALEEAASFVATFGLLDERGQSEAKKMAREVRALMVKP